MIVLISSIVILGGIATGVIKLSSTPTGPTNTTVIGAAPGCGGTYIPPTGYSCYQYQLAYQLLDPFANGGIAATVLVYNANGVNTGDSVTTSSAGSGTSANKYSAGTPLLLKITAANYIGGTTGGYWQPIIVPPYPTTSNIPATILVPLYDTKVNAYTITMTVTPSGSSFSSGQTYSFVATQQSQVTFQYTISANNNNQGWVNSNDPVNKVNQLLVAEFSDGGGASSNTQYVSIGGTHYQSKQGTTNYWQMVLPDGVNQPGCSLVGASCTARDSATSTTPVAWTINPSQQISIGAGTVTGSLTQYNAGTQTTGGSVTFSITVNKNSLTGANTLTLTLKLQQMYDPVFFGQYGNGGTNVAQLGTSFTTVIRGSP